MPKISRHYLARTPQWNLMVAIHIKKIKWYWLTLYCVYGCPFCPLAAGIGWRKDSTFWKPTCPIRRLPLQELSVNGLLPSSYWEHMHARPCWACMCLGVQVEYLSMVYSHLKGHGVYTIVFFIYLDFDHMVLLQGYCWDSNNIYAPLFKGIFFSFTYKGNLFYIEYNRCLMSEWRTTAK